jgi:hypothetical protein
MKTDKKTEKRPKKVRDHCYGIMGRPKKDITEKDVFELAKTHLPVEALANILGCEKTLIYDRFSNALQKGRDARKCSLSETMWLSALEERDVKMMIWLSKQHLGYKEPREEDAGQTVINITVNPIP